MDEAPPGGLPTWVPAELWAEVVAAYASPGRAYHDLEHVREVLRRWGEVERGRGWTKPRETWLAVAFHDAVYVALAKDNEAKSAALARDAIARAGSGPAIARAGSGPAIARAGSGLAIARAGSGLAIARAGSGPAIARAGSGPAIARGFESGAIDVDYVARLVELTAKHGGLAPADVTAEEALFLDCDMAIVGAAPDAFDRYDAGVATEYAAVPAELYAAGRRAFLEGLLAKPRIFLSDFFHEQLDAAARENLRRVLGAR